MTTWPLFWFLLLVWVVPAYLVLLIHIASQRLWADRGIGRVVFASIPVVGLLILISLAIELLAWFFFGHKRGDV